MLQERQAIIVTMIKTQKKVSLLTPMAAPSPSILAQYQTEVGLKNNQSIN